MRKEIYSLQYETSWLSTVLIRISFLLIELNLVYNKSIMVGYSVGIKKLSGLKTLFIIILRKMYYI